MGPVGCLLSFQEATPPWKNPRPVLGLQWPPSSSSDYLTVGVSWSSGVSSGNGRETTTAAQGVPSPSVHQGQLPASSLAGLF